MLNRKFRSSAWRLYAVGFALSFVLLVTRLVLAMAQTHDGIPSGQVRVTLAGGILLLFNLVVPVPFIIANHQLHKMFKRRRKPTDSTPPPQ